MPDAPVAVDSGPLAGASASDLAIAASGKAYTAPTSTSPVLITSSTASRANQNTNVADLNTSLAASAPTSIGTYKGQSINAGPQNEIDAQVKAIDAGQSNTPVKTDTTTTTPAGGDTTTTTPAGGDTSTTTPGVDANGNPDLTAGMGLPPALASEYNSTMAGQKTDMANAQATLAAATATMQNDPAAQMAAQLIEAQFAPLFAAMRAKNTQMLGRANSANAAYGGNGQMGDNFMSTEMDAATQRLADLTTRLQSSLLKSNMAYQAGDVKAFNTAQTAVNKARTDQKTTLATLLTATNNHVKNVQAQAKMDAATAKATLSADISTSKASAPGMVTALAAAGITSLDDPKVAPYVTAYATAHGISDPGTLMGELSTAWDTHAKTTSSITNADAKTKYAVGKPYPTKSGTTPKTTFSSSKGIAAVTPQMESIKGTDGYIDPAKWVAARTNWKSLGGTEASFNSNFKGYLNPVSYPLAGFKAPAASTVL